MLLLIALGAVCKPMKVSRVFLLAVEKTELIFLAICEKSVFYYVLVFDRSGFLLMVGGPARMTFAAYDVVLLRVLK